MVMNVSSVVMIFALTSNVVLGKLLLSPSLSICEAGTKLAPVSWAFVTKALHRGCEVLASMLSTQ